MAGGRTGRILVGNCSWTDPTLIASGGFYPPGTTSAAARLGPRGTLRAKALATDTRAEAI